MKSFKVSKLDIFLISHKTAVTVLLFVFAVFSPIVYHIFDFGPALIPFALWILIYFYTEMLFSQKVMAAERPYTKSLDVEESLQRVSHFLNLLPTKCKKERLALLSDRVALLIILGKFDKAKDAIDILKTAHNIGEYPQIAAIVHMNEANMAAYLGNENEMKENFGIAENYIQKLRPFDLLAKKRLSSEIQRLSLFAKANFSVESDYEEKVISFAKINDPKASGSLAPYQLFGPYFAIFTSYKNNNSEKAKEYANNLIEITNEQLYAYRIAKEYLSDGDESNFDQN